MHISAALGALLVSGDELHVLRNLLRAWYYNDSKSFQMCLQSCGAKDGLPPEVRARDLIDKYPDISAVIDRLLLTVSKKPSALGCCRASDAALAEFEQWVDSRRHIKSRASDLVLFFKERLYRSRCNPFAKGRPTSYKKELFKSVFITCEAFSREGEIGIVIGPDPVPKDTINAWAHLVMWVTGKTHVLVYEVRHNITVNIVFNDTVWQKALSRLQHRLCLSLPLIQSFPSLLCDAASCTTQEAAFELMGRWNL